MMPQYNWFSRHAPLIGARITDAEGNELPELVWCDTDSGEALVLVLVMDDDRQQKIEYVDMNGLKLPMARFQVRRFKPPLKVEWE